MSQVMPSTPKRTARDRVQSSNDETLWRAVLERDAGYDGEIFFAVRSTGIYCRPSCPARRPRRENVVFFSIPEAARQAGFRSCLRCRPDNVPMRDPQVELVRRACRFIEDNASESPTLGVLSEHTRISPFHLQRVFKRLVGVTPRQYADALRLSKFKANVKEGDSVTEALYDAGFGSSSRLYERAPAELGMTPAAYRSGAEGIRIAYATAGCSLGRLLVAATGKGICAVRLGDSDETLEADLVNEYPGATMNRENMLLKKSVEQLLDHINGHLPHLDLPLDVQATAFQRIVWQKLRAIPYGSTRSYKEIARAIGRPAATRAVARACATNPVALVIPCHRVVREDQALGGYRWGIERKQELLEREHKMGPRD